MKMGDLTPTFARDDLHAPRIDQYFKKFTGCGVYIQLVVDVRVEKHSRSRGSGLPYARKMGDLTPPSCSILQTRINECF
jgi:hypothetical protein